MHVLCKFKPTKNAQFELPVVNSVMVSDFENEIFCFTATDIICGTCRWYGKRNGKGGGRDFKLRTTKKLSTIARINLTS